MRPAHAASVEEVTDFMPNDTGSEFSGILVSTLICDEPLDTLNVAMLVRAMMSRPPPGAVVAIEFAASFDARLLTVAVVLAPICTSVPADADVLNV